MQMYGKLIFTLVTTEKWDNDFWSKTVSDYLYVKYSKLWSLSTTSSGRNSLTCSSCSSNTVFLRFNSNLKWRYSLTGHKLYPAPPTDIQYVNSCLHRNVKCRHHNIRCRHRNVRCRFYNVRCRHRNWVAAKNYGLHTECLLKNELFLLFLNVHNRTKT